MILGDNHILPIWQNQLEVTGQKVSLVGVVDLNDIEASQQCKTALASQFSTGYGIGHGQSHSHGPEVLSCAIIPFPQVLK